MSFASTRHRKSITYGFVALLCCIAFIIYTLSASAASVSGNFEHVSVNNTGDGQGANATTLYPQISANGRFVAFESTASNLVNDDTNNKRDVFVRDTKLNITQRVNISSNGVESNADSTLLAMSENGRYILYSSTATNLEGGPNSYSMALEYMHDMKTGSNKHIPASGGSNNNASLDDVSNDGRYILSTSTPGLHDANGANLEQQRVFVYDNTTNTWSRIAPPLDGIEQRRREDSPMMSCDGAFMVFRSGTTNTISEPDTNNQEDIFLADMRKGNKLTNITGAFNDRSWEPRISCNGNYILFRSTATNIDGNPPYTVDGHYYIYNRLNESFSLVDLQSNGSVMYDAGARGLTDEGMVIFIANTRQTQPKTPHYYLRDTEDQTTENITDNNGQHLRADSWGPVLINAIDSHGKKFIMLTNRTDIVPSDSNGFNELFISDLN